MRRIARKVVFNVCAVACHMALLTALLVCTLGSVSSSANGTLQVSHTRTAVSAPAGLQPRAAATEDKGDFKLVYRPIKDKGLAHIERLIKNSRLFEGLVAASNKELSLPVDIAVVFRECNGKDEDPDNAFYDPEDHSITLCYGLVEKTEELFKDDETSEEECKSPCSVRPPGRFTMRWATR